MLAALCMLTRAGGLGRRASSSVGHLVHAHHSWGVLDEGRQAVLAALYMLTRAGGLGRRASGGVGRLELVEDTLREVAWDQASIVVVTRPLVRVRMLACPASAPEQRDEMTEPGCFFCLR